MPELPEVETVRQSLKLKVCGKIIEDVRVYWDGIIEYPDVKVFCSKIKKQRINEIDMVNGLFLF